MSSRSIGRGICPKCGQEGVLYIRRLGDREYVYFKHGKRWCYIGPKTNVDIEKLLQPQLLESQHTKNNENTSSTSEEIKILNIKNKQPTIYSKFLRIGKIPLFIALLISIIIASAALYLSLYHNVHNLNVGSENFTGYSSLHKYELELESLLHRLNITIPKKAQCKLTVKNNMIYVVCKVNNSRESIRISKIYILNVTEEKTIGLLKILEEAASCS